MKTEEEIKKYQREYYRKNREKLLNLKKEYQREYYVKNLEKILDYGRNYRKENGERYIEKMKVRNSKKINELQDTYLIDLIINNGANPTTITPEMIEEKRMNLKLKRVIKEVKKKIKNVNQ